MSNTRINLAAIAFDAGTQVRAAISEQVVTEYAELMRESVDFPPIVLFHDGNGYYLADGFHRALASQRVGFKDISAEVKAGTKTDALWFALGANERNGLRMTPADKRHAILLAFQAWPDRSAHVLAKQIGCSQDYVSQLRDQVKDSFQLPARVTGKDGKSYPASRSSVPSVDPKRTAVAALIKAGKSSAEIRKQCGAHPQFIATVRRELGVGTIDKSRDAIGQRMDRMRQMAHEGFTSRQIASAVGMTEHGCRTLLRKSGVSIPADKAVGNAKRHDSTRIIERMVMDAENLTADVNLIELGDLHPQRFSEWIESLTASRKSLDQFIRQLVKEQQKHGEAA